MSFKTYLAMAMEYLKITSRCRFWGGYTSIEYGYIHDTYLSLTGGVYDAIHLEKTRLKPGDIYFRIRRAISQGAIVGCAVSVSFCIKYIILYKMYHYIPLRMFDPLISLITLI